MGMKIGGKGRIMMKVFGWKNEGSKYESRREK